jgi:hypothetical protein
MVVAEVEEEEGNTAIMTAIVESIHDRFFDYESFTVLYVSGHFL